MASGKGKKEVSFFATALENNISSKEGIVFTNRFGRKTTLKSIAPHFESGSREIKGMDKRRGKNTCVPSFRSTYSSQENQLSDDHNDWHCCVCMAFEREKAEDDDILLSCDGPCLRSFHLSCVGLRNPPAAEESWLCDSCIEKEHTCFLCGDSGSISDVCGVDGSEERAMVEGCYTSQKSSILSSMVTKCRLSRCGKFFHLGCIERSGFFESGLFSRRSLSASTNLSQVSFVCGHHRCWTCDGSSKRSGSLHKCLTCPRAFHVGCIPPGTEFHEYALVCYLCIKEGHTLPPLFLKSQQYVGGEKTAKATIEGGELEWSTALHRLANESHVKNASAPDEKNKFDARHFCLPDRVLHDVESRPPYFQTIITNQYGSIPMPRAEPGDCGGGEGGGCSCHNFSRSSNKKRGPNCGETYIESTNSELKKKTCLLGGSSAANGDPFYIAVPPASSSGDVDNNDSCNTSGASLSKAPFSLVCGGSCENRLLRIECFGGNYKQSINAKALSRNDESKNKNSIGRNDLLQECGKRNTTFHIRSSKEKWCNCSIGVTCGNRQIGQRQGNVKVQPFMENGMGWGLKTLEDVKKGKLIREYVGEVLTEDMLTERMEYQRKHDPTNVNMYVMELENGLYLDAREKGNLSRFINHGCDPNWLVEAAFRFLSSSFTYNTIYCATTCFSCDFPLLEFSMIEMDKKIRSELQKWSVQGITRIGIFAKRDIPCGEPLSYDYQFSTNEHGRFRCHCGAINCRGSLSSEGFEENTHKSNGKSGKRKRITKFERKKLLKKAKRELELQSERAMIGEERKARRLNLTSIHCPGDPSHFVKEGPKKKYFVFAQESRLFLVRNVKKGNRMLHRRGIRRKISPLSRLCN